jgi:DNA-directed RNA polymerase specialized sigma24 family protein
MNNSNSPDSILFALSKEELILSLKRIKEHLKENYHLSEQELSEAKTKQEEIKIPVSIFSHELSPSEALVKFLKENIKLNYHKIAELIKRDERGVWGSYQRAIKKQASEFQLKPDEKYMPGSAFKKDISILESLVSYLKDKENLSGAAISKLLDKKPSTIWTAYKRAKEKNEK